MGAAAAAGNEGDDAIVEARVFKYTTQQVFFSMKKLNWSCISKICYNSTYKFCHELAFEYTTKLGNKFLKN